VPPAKVRGVIEIEVSGARIRVEPGVELATLSTVLSALRIAPARAALRGAMEGEDIGV
jgi:hypothetical protein